MIGGFIVKINVNLKSVAKRKHSVKPVEYEIEGRPSTVRELILAVTAAGVKEYNERMDNSELLRYLTKEEMDDKAQSGKIGFGVNYGSKKADLLEAQENSIQCFEDGIYRIFLDSEQLEDIDKKILITEQSLFTFVRLTMLAGRMW